MNLDDKYKIEEVNQILDEKRDHRICQGFANKHKLIFEDRGECGFGRACVGLDYGGNWLNFNPRLQKLDYEIVEGFKDTRVRPGKEAPDAYHKHDCMAVLVHNDDYEKAISQLARWIEKLEAIPEGVEVVEYETGNMGMQALLSGLTGKAIRVKTNALV